MKGLWKLSYPKRPVYISFDQRATACLVRTPTSTLILPYRYYNHNLITFTHRYPTREVVTCKFIRTSSSLFFDSNFIIPSDPDPLLFEMLSPELRPVITNPTPQTRMCVEECQCK